MTDSDHSKGGGELAAARGLFRFAAKPGKAAEEVKSQPTTEDVARTALHIIEVQGVEAVKDFLVRLVEAEKTRRNIQGNA